MLKLLKYAKKYIVPALLSPILMVGEVILELMIPLVMADIVDIVQSQSGMTDESMNQIIRLGLRMLLYAFGSLFCGAMAARVASVAGMGFGARLREVMIDKIQKFSFSNIDRFSTASLITRLTTDVNSVQNTFLMLIRMLFRSPVMFAVALFFTVRMSPEVSKAFLVSLPLIAVILIIFAPIALKRFRKMLEMFDGFNGSIQENLTNIRVVKAFVRSDYEKDKFKKSNDNLMQAALHAEKLMILGQPAFMIIMYGTILAILYIIVEHCLGEHRWSRRDIPGIRRTQIYTGLCRLKIVEIRHSFLAALRSLMRNKLCKLSGNRQCRWCSSIDSGNIIEPIGKPIELGIIR